MTGFPESGADWQQVYEALALGERREIVDYLSRTSGAITIEDVAIHLLEADGGDYSEERMAFLEAKLYHAHLPRLVEAGIVRWDRAETGIALSEFGARLPTGIVRPDTLDERGLGVVQGEASD